MVFWSTQCWSDFRNTPANAAEALVTAQDPPEYFDRPGGFLAYKADVPAAMLAAAVPKEMPLTLNGTQDHFRLMHHQLLQMRSAWAIAQVIAA